ncbi:MAG TPA: hybrid sensor histidine kinase/response regulator [Bryobacteraceae bacterium]|jgi:signal transduction histidine kinase|nr:hybrid sensor histidine kinase/response regulator [Bryobacteraceae bacterium]
MKHDGGGDKRVRVLLVDDSPANLLALQAGLEGVDAELVLASSGYEALREVLAGEFAAIILDVAMPGLDGFETAALIRARKRSADTPIIFMTAYQNDGHQLRGYSLGAVDFLLKPVAAEVLRSKVKVFVDLARKAIILERLAEQIRELNTNLEAEVEKRTAELKKAQIAAQAADKAKSQFLASMSHELRTPLNAVIGYSEMLEEEAEERGIPTLVADARKIGRAANHLLHLINDVLDLSKIEAGKMSVTVERFNIAAMLDDVIEAARPLITANRNRLDLKSPASSVTMTSDGTKVRQCLLNLLSNAAKFTLDGAIRLEVVCDPDHVTFHVSDTGVGMSGEQTARLFAPFTQVHTGDTRGGTGLGLAITGRLCKLLRGEISVMSNAGKGSTFTLNFPLEIAAERETAAATSQ